MHLANERWSCSLTPSLIGWAHTQNDPFICRHKGEWKVRHVFFHVSHVFSAVSPWWTGWNHSKWLLRFHKISLHLNTLRPRQDGRHFPDDILKWIFLNEDVRVSNDVMTSSNGNIFHVTGHLCGKFTGPRWISRTKASDAELWCFLWCTPE